MLIQRSASLGDRNNNNEIVVGKGKEEYKMIIRKISNDFEPAKCPFLWKILPTC